ncbi:MAG: hypothetical protein ABL986_08790 [Vicinamibacterales bacterium]
MPSSVTRLALMLTLAIAAWQTYASAGAQSAGGTVSGTINVTSPAGRNGRAAVRADRSGVVVWLMPVGASPRVRPTGADRPRFTMVQRGKRFLPRVLVIPVGSVVDFPNFDPIFHNVFSLFEGKRFDLGLYEAGSSRSVTFASPGVSHVFCNIHPDMSAIVAAVDTDYFAASATNGTFSIANVPAGRYRLNVWHDRFAIEGASDYPKEITVSAGGLVLGDLRFSDSGQALPAHTNKFGHGYIPPNAASPIYQK